MAEVFSLSTRTTSAMDGRSAGSSLTHCMASSATAVASAASSADMDRAGVAATEGQIGAVNDESWVAVDLSDDLSGDGADDGVAIEDRAVFRTEKIKGVLLHPYRYGKPPPPKLARLH